MIHVLSKEAGQLVQELARDRPLVALDFDGTLAPLVDDPRDARMRENTRALLRVMAPLYPCAVVSGRARADVATRVEDASLVAVVGNHGAEGGSAAPPADLRARVLAWANTLRQGLRGDDVEVEDKGFTVAVHYRRARDRAEARGRIVHLASTLSGARVFGGHAVVNVAPTGAPTKGDAIARLAAEWPAHPVVYVGDDDTDEDAFRSPLVTHPVRVGRSERSAARYYVDDQADVDRLLWALVAARAGAAGLGDAWRELDPAQKLGGVE